jgi:DNA-damage-inducible protein J
MGLTVSDAFRLLLVKIAKDKALPFDLLVPNRGADGRLRPSSRRPFDFKGAAAGQRGSGAGGR